MTDLTSLIEKLEKAERSSDELDAHIRCALLADKDAYVERSAFNGAWCVYSGEYNGRPRLVEPQHNRAPHSLWVAEFTRSIDAAISLAERVLPGWIVEHIGQDYSSNPPMLRGMGWCVELTDGENHSQGQSKSFAIAWLLATLRALQQRGGNA